MGECGARIRRRLIPLGSTAPNPALAMFGQHHVHEIPILAAVDSHEAGKSPYGLHHLAGTSPNGCRTGSVLTTTPTAGTESPGADERALQECPWRLVERVTKIMLRTATRGGSVPDQRSATIGFRCAKSSTSTTP